MTKQGILLLSLLLCGIFLPKCGKNQGFAPDSKVTTPPADALFERVTGSGFEFENNIKEDYNNWILSNSYLYNGGGVGILDFDNDGLQDIYMVSTQGACKLFQNKGNFKFSEVAKQAGVEAFEGEKTGVTIADVNADGWQDIYVCRTGL
ncbi:MAG: VCBS repeat-containing protein, partial [Bacteroidetes bacterium]|nr:VCBS repeat-containing protein [Bacteroidota bacterium]